MGLDEYCNDDIFVFAAAVIIEALASSESMSTALGRRMTELSRSIEERFEMISMTLNGFLESCIRIQDGSPLVEEHIARVLERLLDTVENRFVCLFISHNTSASLNIFCVPKNKPLVYFSCAAQTRPHNSG